MSENQTNLSLEQENKALREKVAFLEKQIKSKNVEISYLIQEANDFEDECIYLSDCLSSTQRAYRSLQYSYNELADELEQSEYFGL